MPQDDRDILDILKFELEFLKKGGYGRSPREPWRAQLVFEDSPSCMNFDSKDHPSPCSECALMQFVPADCRNEKVPCRHIPLTAEGETLYGLYRGATQAELEDAMANWLCGTIAQLEAKRDEEARASATDIAPDPNLEVSHVPESSPKMRQSELPRGV